MNFEGKYFYTVFGSGNFLMKVFVVKQACNVN